MVDIVDTAFSCGRTLIVCKFLQESSKVKESSLHEIWNADTAFLLGGGELMRNVTVSADWLRATWAVGSLWLYTVLSEVIVLSAEATSYTWAPNLVRFGIQ